MNVSADYEGKETFALVKKIRKIAEHYYSDEYYLAGEGVSTYDLMDTITADMMKVNLLAIGAVFIVLLFTMKSLILPIYIRLDYLSFRTVSPPAKLIFLSISVIPYCFRL